MMIAELTIISPKITTGSTKQTCGHYTFKALFVINVNIIL